MARIPFDDLHYPELIDMFGMASTYRAYVRAENGETTEVRVRRLSDKFEVPPEMATVLADEAARAMAMHGETFDTIVAYDLGEQPYIATAAHEAVSLGELLASLEGGLPASIVSLIGWDTSRALAIAHGATPEMTHRALCPESLTVTYEGTTITTDFALGALLSDLAKTNSKVLHNMSAHHAPEQIQGGAAVAASDIFSLGSILYESIAGERAFTGSSAMEITMKAQMSAFTPLTEKVPDVPPELADLVHRMLSGSLDERPTALDVATALERLVDPSMIGREQLGEVARNARNLDRRRTVQQAAMSIDSDMIPDFLKPEIGPPRGAAVPPVSTPVLSRESFKPADPFAAPLPAPNPTPAYTPSASRPPATYSTQAIPEMPMANVSHGGHAPPPMAPAPAPVVSGFGFPSEPTTPDEVGSYAENVPTRVDQALPPIRGSEFDNQPATNPGGELPPLSAPTTKVLSPHERPDHRPAPIAPYTPPPDPSRSMSSARPPPSPYPSQAILNEVRMSGDMETPKVRRGIPGWLLWSLVAIGVFGGMGLALWAVLTFV